MKISYNWLKQYLEFDLTPEETEEKLTLLGLEVEEVMHVGSDFEGFVVGEVLDVKNHPNADKLSICDVNTGDEKVQIICGAKNVAKGQKVAVAMVGSTLPVPMEDGSLSTIKKAKLRGEYSHGMICSESELGLSDNHEGIMVLNSSLNVGSPLKTALNVEKDTVFEIGLTPNRPDAACHIGVARDLGAVIETSIENPYHDIAPKNGSIDDKISITIKDTDKCHRYVGVLVSGVEIKDSPAWLKNRLTSIGLRPINNIVDATNYVMHEIGQPLHAFDYKQINDHKIEVKSFDKEIEFITLDSVKRKVTAGSLFICDGKGPVAIAGVMGGENSEVTESTSTILIESAYFDPTSIRKTSKNLALQTDSSYRFERGIDPNIQLKAAYKAAQLIVELAGGSIVDGFADEHPVKTSSLKVDLRVSRVNKLLGTTLGKDKISSILTNLEIENSVKSDDTLSCTVPTFRPDITREVDLIEEVGRVFDYNNIPRPDSAPFIAPETLSELEVFHQRVKKFAKGLGYKEITTNSLLSKKEATLLADKSEHVDTLNPVSLENTTLRTHLTAGFLKAVTYNLNRKATSLKFFELGHVFRKTEKKQGTWVDGVQEHVHLLLGLCGDKNPADWSSNAESYSFFDLKSDLEAFLDHFGARDLVQQEAKKNEELIYTIGEYQLASIQRGSENLMKGFDIDRDYLVSEVDLTVLFNEKLHEAKTTYTPVSKYPSFEFDAAFIVDQTVRTGELSINIRETAGSILNTVNVFDIYEGENIGKDKKSIAFRLSFLDSNKTLTISEVEPIVKKIVQSLEKSFGAKLRS